MRYGKKNKPLSYPVIILKDDRERVPWKFDKEMFEVRKQRLEVGDYTIKGFEKILAVEKKESLHELFTNLSGAYRPQFKRFLRKMSKIRYKYIVIGDSPDRIPQTVKQCRGTRMKDDTLYFWLNQIVVSYGIPIIFLGNHPTVQKRMLASFWGSVLKELGG